MLITFVRLVKMIKNIIYKDPRKFVVSEKLLLEKKVECKSTIYFISAWNSNFVKILKNHEHFNNNCFVAKNLINF